MSNPGLATYLRPTVIRLFLTISLLAGFSQTAWTHPLGNFTVSHYTRLEIAPDRIALRYVIDMAELSTFQEFEVIDTNGNRAPDQEELTAYGQRMAAQYAQGLQLTINGERLSVQVVRQQVRWQQGEGGLPNLRLECDLLTALPALPVGAAHRLHFEDTNRRDRSGWREIVVLPQPGVAIFDSTAFGSGVTDELKVFPKDLLAGVLSEQAAELSFTHGTAPAGARMLQTRAGQKVKAQARLPFTALLTMPNLMTKVGLLCLLLLALGYGYRRVRQLSAGV